MVMKYYGTLRLQKNPKRWVLKAEPHVNIRIKDIFRQVDKSDIGELKIAYTPQSCKDLDWFLMRYPLEVSDNDAAELAKGKSEYEKRQDDMERILLPGYKTRELQLVKPLRNYQSLAVELLIQGGSLLCGDDVGLGKTVVAIGGFVAATDALPALVVCQTHLPIQWKEKCEEFAPQLRIHIINKLQPYDLPEADVYLMSYSKLRGWGEVFREGFFKFVVFDECQELRNSGSAKYTAAKCIANMSKYCLGLSATPVYNYGGEIFNVMNVISEGCLGRMDEFVREWCDGGYHSDNKIRVKDPKALGAYLRENFLLVRRTREEVGRELPPVNKIVHQVEYNENYAERVEKDLKQIAARVVSGSFIERGQAARMLDIQARMMTGVAKAHGVADYVKVLAENGEKILLVGWHREVYEVWMKELEAYNPVMYTGSESPIQKNKNRELFVSGKSQIMIMSLRAAVGLDGLQDVCKIVVFGELDWSPGVHEQVIGRLARDGQQNQVMSIFLTTPNGTDPLMIDVLGLKASQSEGIMNPTSSEIIRTVSSEDRIKELAHNILRK